MVLEKHSRYKKKISTYIVNTTITINPFKVECRDSGWTPEGEDTALAVRGSGLDGSGSSAPSRSRSHATFLPLAGVCIPGTVLVRTVGVDATAHR